jgi:hypothetical protein
MAHFEHFRAVLVVLSGFGVCKWVICVHFEHSKSPFQTLFRRPKSVQNGLILSTFEHFRAVSVVLGLFWPLLGAFGCFWVLLDTSINGIWTPRETI